MKIWNQWTRKHDGWVERKHRFQKMFREGILGATDPRVPALAGATVPVTRGTARDRGAK